MHTIKSCIASMLLAAFCISTAVDARVLDSRSADLIGDAMLGARALDMPIKRESRDEAIARARLAKRKAIIKAKRAANTRKTTKAALAKAAQITPAPQVVDLKALAKAAVAAGRGRTKEMPVQPQTQQNGPVNAAVPLVVPGRGRTKAPPVPAFSPPGPIAPAYTPTPGPFQKKCTIDANCLNQPGVPLPDHGQARCDTSRFIPICIAGCEDGYVPSGGQCVPNQPACGVESCGTPPTGGVFVCQNNACTLMCDPTRGYAQIGSTCMNVGTDVNNCGQIGRVCPFGYNGVGNPTCTIGTCSLACPPGTVPRNGPNGMYCFRM